MQKWNVKRVRILIFVLCSTQMVLCRHLVTEIPIVFPASTDRVAWRVIDIDELLVAEGVRAGDISDKVVEIETLDIPWIIRCDLFDTVLAIFCFDEIDARETTLEFGSNILKCKIFVDSDETPMRNTDCLDSLLQNQLGLHTLKKNRH